MTSVAYSSLEYYIQCLRIFQQRKQNKYFVKCQSLMSEACEAHKATLFCIVTVLVLFYYINIVANYKCYHCTMFDNTVSTCLQRDGTQTSNNDLLSVYR